MNAENCKNLLELFYRQYKNQNENEIFLQSLKDSKKYFTWHDTYQNIIKLAQALSLIIKKQDRCLLISENRPEWLISDLAIMFANGITVPAYTTYVERDYEYIINDCKPSVIIVSDQIQFSKIKKIVKAKPFIKAVITFEDIKDIDVELINTQKIFDEKKFIKKSFENLDIKRTDIACIIYTSGTEGNPKGVMLSHGGILNNCEGSILMLEEIISNKAKFLTWLPLSHSYEHTIQFIQIAVGAKVFYAESIDKLIKNMNDCNPNIMTAVPRFYQNLYQKINSNFDKIKGLKKILINRTIL